MKEHRRIKAYLKASLKLFSSVTQAAFGISPESFVKKTVG